MTAASRPTPPVFPPIDDAEIVRRFTSHQPESWQIHAMEEVRTMAQDLARRLVVLVPGGREQALALTHLEEMVFQANAGISRYKPPQGQPAS
jgi:hypothetical protein